MYIITSVSFLNSFDSMHEFSSEYNHLFLKTWSIFENQVFLFLCINIFFNSILENQGFPIFMHQKYIFQLLSYLFLERE